MKACLPNFIADRFLLYQLRWLADPELFKIGLWARQTGKDFTCAAEAVFDCAARAKAHWLIIACGERQALESLQKVRDWVAAIDLAGRSFSPMLESGAEMSATEVRFANGSRITALPAKPETVRGYSANVILTEFAFHDDPEAIWRAVFPTVTNELCGGPKKLRIISTPNGQGNMFHDLWLNSKLFSKHRVTIHDAKAAGLPLDLERLRAGLFEAEAWTQEYECEFIDKSCVLLPYELIESCESAEAMETNSPDWLSRLSSMGGELFVGIDFGRKQDLTACWVLQRVGTSSTPSPTGHFITREVLVLERMPTPEQFEILRERVSRARRVCVDYTGAGIGLGDLLAREFGEYRPLSPSDGERARARGTGKVELCPFTAALKQELFPKLRAAFERGQVRIPRSSAIREDLHGIHRITTNNGQFVYRASNSADGHSDRCTALALALRAAESRPPATCASSVGPGYRSGIGRARIC
ncbi:MAG TPA: terminase family protein [Verrucomicrobiae bacterium]|nr:terminase family protein [Verrucomicrobiae bacterium]